MCWVPPDWHLRPLGSFPRKFPPVRCVPPYLPIWFLLALFFGGRRFRWIAQVWFGAFGRLPILVRRWRLLGTTDLDESKKSFRGCGGYPCPGGMCRPVAVAGRLPGDQHLGREQLHPGSYARAPCWPVVRLPCGLTPGALRWGWVDSGVGEGWPPRPELKSQHSPRGAVWAGR